jgi:hypothetical protein
MSTFSFKAQYERGREYREFFQSKKLKHRKYNGMKFVVIRYLTPDVEFMKSEIVPYMVRIKLENDEIIDAYPEEVAIGGK